MRTVTRQDALEVDGFFEEVNEITDLHGYNLTLGLLYTLNRYISVGASLDLPWTARADQKQTVRNQLTTLDASRTRVVSVTDTEEVTEKEVEFDFPLYWGRRCSRALGATVLYHVRCQPDPLV